MRHAYLHGFASSSFSFKGQALRRFYSSHDVVFETPDLNHPSFAELTYTGMLTAVSQLDDEGGGESSGEAAKWRFVGSSMGGYTAARWAELNPERVDRLILLCPAFDFVERWPALLGEQTFERWREEGTVALPDGMGRPIEVHYGLVEDAINNHPARPVVPCETVIVHGTRDTVVPIASSRAYAKANPERVRLVEVDDDHLLKDSLELIQELAMDFMISPRRTLWWDHFGPTAKGTAEHFLIHLDEFLEREGISGCETGVEVLKEGQHAAAWCRSPEAKVEVVGRALRPRRVE